MIKEDEAVDIEAKMQVTCIGLTVIELGVVITVFRIVHVTECLLCATMPDTHSSIHLTITTILSSVGTANILLWQKLVTCPN